MLIDYEKLVAVIWEGLSDSSFSGIVIDSCGNKQRLIGVDGRIEKTKLIQLIHFIAICR